MKHPACRYHGSKFRLAPWIISHLPEHTTYVEPFAGGAGVLLQKPRVYAEVYNDLDQSVVNFFEILRDYPGALKRQLQLTPYSRIEFNNAKGCTPADGYIERARKFAVRSMMGFGSASAIGDSGFSSDSKRKYSLVAHYWQRYPERIAALTERLQGVIIENKPATDIIRLHDGENTLFYCDPPYVRSTRSNSKNKCYSVEMTDVEHEALLNQLLGVTGKVAISGYGHEMYFDLLKDWEVHSKGSRISAQRGTKVNTEYLWVKR